jgi:squalene-hopene/tetraprenyl-beta-curcumene cyclase
MSQQLNEEKSVKKKLNNKFDSARSIEALSEAASRAAGLAKNWFMSRQLPDGHWCAELESNATLTAEYVMLYQALGLHIDQTKGKQIIQYLLGNQKPDGSWGIAHNYSGDVSTTTEVYFALRLLGLPPEDRNLNRAEDFIRANGGIEKVRIFTRINLALFGLFPWSAIPVIPPEFILLPPESPVNIYTLSSWARSTMVPLFIIFHHKPVFALPNGRSDNNDWLDHLWLNPKNKNIAYAEPWLDVLKTEGISYKSFFAASDLLLRAYDKALEKTNSSSLFKTLSNLALPVIGTVKDKLPREYAVKKCEEWVLERQEETGDWAGIMPPMINGVLALTLNGHGLDSSPVQRGLDAIERFVINDENGFRVQACVSPVWDTVLGMRALIDCGVNKDDAKILAARKWVDAKQIRKNYGDWKVYNPNGTPGGWSFEYENTWYPDVDDTAAVMNAFLLQDMSSKSSETIQRAAQWIVSMQNRDGGWGAFDKDNDKLFLNQIPFSDMDSLCDPSSPDVTGRVLEAFGLLNDTRYSYTVKKALEYIRKTQEPEGSWYGRWGVNYIYGTSNVLCGLQHQDIPLDDAMIVRALDWLKSKQNSDGGWGECLESYADRNKMGVGASTASQTAWALMGLLAYLPATDDAICRGISWLCAKQVHESSSLQHGSWNEEEFTGTGFPNHFYLRYHYYRHFFPMMALGRFVTKSSN